MTISNVESIINDMLTAEENLLDATVRLRMAFCHEEDNTPALKHKKEDRPVPSLEPVSTPEAKSEKTYTLESVRGILADKSTKGFQKEIKAILTAHGAEKLSALPPDEYAAVVAEVEALGNA